jgi:hypothetical protein
MAELITTSLISDANLASYYRFNSGALTTDSKGSSTLTDHGTVAETASGKYGYAADFGTGNTTDFFTLATTFGITDATSQFSINMWVKFPYGEPSGLVNFFDLRPSSNDCYFEARYSSGSIAVDAKGTADSYAVNLADSKWHMMTAIRNGTNFKLYIDTVQRISVTEGVGVATGGFFLGNNSGGTRAINAIMDDVAIFTKALSALEMDQLYAETGGSFIFNMI